MVSLGFQVYVQFLSNLWFWQRYEFIFVPLITSAVQVQNLWNHIHTLRLPVGFPGYVILFSRLYFWLRYLAKTCFWNESFFSFNLLITQAVLVGIKWKYMHLFEAYSSFLSYVVWLPHVVFWLSWVFFASAPKLNEFRYKWFQNLERVSSFPTSYQSNFKL